MALTQKYGIKYPFTSDNDEEIYIDLNKDVVDETKSKVLHVLFTPKGQKLRNPDFGTDLIKYLFNPADGSTENELKTSLKEDISKYVPNVEFNDISIVDDDKSENGRIIIVHYSVQKGNNTKEATSVAVKI
jgi:phage baseplate assembly protein W